MLLLGLVGCMLASATHARAQDAEASRGSFDELEPGGLVLSCEGPRAPALRRAIARTLASAGHRLASESQVVETAASIGVNLGSATGFRDTLRYLAVDWVVSCRTRRERRLLHAEIKVMDLDGAEMVTVRTPLRSGALETSLVPALAEALGEDDAAESPADDSAPQDARPSTPEVAAAEPTPPSTPEVAAAAEGGEPAPTVRIGYRSERPRGELGVRVVATAGVALRHVEVQIRGRYGQPSRLQIPMLVEAGAALRFAPYGNEVASAARGFYLSGEAWFSRWQSWREDDVVGTLRTRRGALGAGFDYALGQGFLGFEAGVGWESRTLPGSQEFATIRYRTLRGRIQGSALRIGRRLRLEAHAEARYLLDLGPLRSAFGSAAGGWYLGGGATLRTRLRSWLALVVQLEGGIAVLDFDGKGEVRNGTSGRERALAGTLGLGVWL